MGLHIVVVGNPVDGFSFYGPFKTADHAIEEAEQSLQGQNWWIAPLEELFIEQGTHYNVQEHKKEKTYSIVRFYDDDRPRKVIATGLSLEEAAAHCNDSATKDEDWFDGYREE